MLTPYLNLCILVDEQAKVEEHYQTLITCIQYQDYVSAFATVFKGYSFIYLNIFKV